MRPLQEVQVVTTFDPSRSKLNEALAQKYPNSFSQNAKERGKEARFRKNAGNVLLRPHFFCLQQLFNLVDHIHDSGAVLVMKN
jgi:hypothetical protein